MMSFLERLHGLLTSIYVHISDMIGRPNMASIVNTLGAEKKKKKTISISYLFLLAGGLAEPVVGSSLYDHFLFFVICSSAFLLVNAAH